MTTTTSSQPQSQLRWLSSERTKGFAVLFTVPIAWGTYGPVVRYLYEIQPAVPGFVFSACYYAVASLTTLGIVATQEQQQRRRLRDSNNTKNSSKINAASNQELSSKESSSSITTKTNATTTTTTTRSSTFPILGGLELGSYLFVANCLQVIGLRTVPSDRAGFLVQLTTVMVPVAEALLMTGNLFAISARTWFSCGLAFCGICVMNLDGLLGTGVGGSRSTTTITTTTATLMASISAAFRTFTQGDVLIFLAAVLYTVHVVRLGRYAKETTPMKLAASKATVETFLGTGLVLGLTAFAAATGEATATTTATAAGSLISFLQDSGTEISTFFSAITEGIAAGTVPPSAITSAVGATFWTGLVTCAYTIYAQSYGQKRVGPTDANLIYSFQPICTALFAFLLLGETMGVAGVVGGALIGAAVYLIVTVSTGDNDNDNTNTTNDNDEHDDDNDDESKLLLVKTLVVLDETTSKEVDPLGASNNEELIVDHNR